MTGFSFVPGTVADAGAPPITQIRLMALKQAAQAQAGESQDGMLRAAIVNVARYYLRLAASKTPAEMEALIWQRDSTNGADHGESCAAFASLTLELAAQVVGQQSWVTGGSTYPWPLQDWADVRVDPNSGSPQIVSVRQDAQAHDRWHPLGDGYQPQAGDWVLFDGHVEVVTSYAQGVLDTIGGDSLPNFTVNAHQFSGPLAAQGVMGFVDNGDLARAAGSQGEAAERPAPAASGTTPHASGNSAAAASTDADAATVAEAAVPGLAAATAPAGSAAARVAPGSGTAIPGVAAAGPGLAPPGPERPRPPWPPPPGARSRTRRPRRPGRCRSSRACRPRRPARPRSPARPRRPAQRRSPARPRRPARRPVPPHTAGTSRRPRPRCRAVPPSRRSSVRLPRGRSRRSAGTASRRL